MQILYNANVYTLDPHNPRLSAIAILQDKIIATGNDYAMLSRYSQSNAKNEKATCYDLEGLTVLPGLSDAHIHLEKYSLNLNSVDCETETKTECLKRIAQQAAKTSPGEWIRGHGWNQNNWKDGFGTGLELDQVAPFNPVYLTAKSLHAAWVNSSALHQAQLSAASSDPVGGRIQRTKDNQPSGILFESAMQIVEDCIPKPTLKQITQAIEAALPGLWWMGLTSLHDFDGSDCFSALQILHQENKLNLRVVKSIPHENLSNAIALGLRSGFGDKTLRIGNVKLFADGALSQRTAAMLQPYQNDPDNRGILLIDEEEFFDIGREALGHGLGLAVHAIGDRANHEILNGYCRLYQEFQANFSRFRNRIEHVQLIHPEDAGRLSEMGIIASMQPIHATSDMNMANQYWDERSKTAYAWRLLLERGTILAFGSDAPVESPNPFWGLHAAITRQRADGSPGPEGWYPAQRIDRYKAIQAYSAAPAFAAGLENDLGKITPGFLADLIVLPQDPFTCPPDDLRNIRPLATMIGGEWLFSEFN